MKPSLIFIMITFVICAQTCKKSNLPKPMSVTEVFKYSDQANIPCTAKIKHDSEQVVLTGFIQKLNTFPNENRFQIFDKADITGSRIDVNVIDNSKEIFKLISDKLNNLKDEDYKAITIYGTLQGKALHMNGTCKMGTFINLSKKENINF